MSNKYSVKLGEHRFRCTLCPHQCELSIGEQGRCMARSASEDGVTLHGYGKITNINVEPIEKKPIYHFEPGMKTLSAGGYGCSMNCDYCQNYLVSQRDRAETSRVISPEELVGLAISRNCRGICFTYNEPTVYFEYIMDVAELCSDAGLSFILKTNAYLEQDPWYEVCRVTDAMNIDWKGSESRYNDVAEVEGEHIIRQRIQEAVLRGVHIEISVPVYTDATVAEYEPFFRFIAAIDSEIPIHLLKIFPCNRISHVALTSDILILRCYEAAKKILRNVYVHGVHGFDNSTKCQTCDATLVERKGLRIEKISHGCDCGQ